VTCRAKLHAKGTETDIHALMKHTATVAEIRNTRTHRALPI